MRLLAPLVALLAVLAAAGPARAHGIGTSQLHLVTDDARLTGTYTLDVRDARTLAGLPAGSPGVEAFRELEGRADSLRAAIAGTIVLAADGAPCPLEFPAAPLEWVADLEAVRMPVLARCATAPTHLTVRMDAVFERDPGHRAFFSVEDARATNVGTLRNDLREATFPVKKFDLAEILREFVREGVVHIWGGIDHLLFLLSLLLPAGLVRAGRGWTPRPGFGAAAREVVKVVTAFTVAHSITLVLASLGVVRLPSRWVETAIAVSVFLAAWNNLRPFLPGRAWAMAFGFGLVHGFGFAGALGGLSLPRQARMLALGAFNVGVELGQLAIVAVALPLLYFASRRAWYPRLVMGAGSLAIAWIAVLWVLERGFGLVVFPA